MSYWNKFGSFKDNVSKIGGKIGQFTEKIINDNIKMDDDEEDDFFKDLSKAPPKKTEKDLNQVLKSKPSKNLKDEDIFGDDPIGSSPVFKKKQNPLNTNGNKDNVINLSKSVDVSNQANQMAKDDFMAAFKSTAPNQETQSQGQTPLRDPKVASSQEIEPTQKESAYSKEEIQKMLQFDTKQPQQPPKEEREQKPEISSVAEESYQQKESELQSQIQQLQQQLFEASQKANQLEAKDAVNQQQIQELASKNLDLEGKINEQSQQIAQSKRDHELLEQEKFHLSGQNEKLQDQNDDLNERAQEAKQYIQQLQNQRDQYEKELEEKQTQKPSEEEGENKTVECTKSVAEQLLANLKQQIMDLLNDSDAKDEIVEKLSFEINDSILEGINIKEEAQNQQQETSHDNNHLQEKVEQLTNDKKYLEQQLNNLEQSLQKQKDENQKTEQEYQELVTKISSLNEEIENEKAKTVELQSKFDKQDLQLSEYKQLISIKNDQIDELQQSLSSQQQNGQQEVQKKLKAYESKIGELNSENKMLQQQYQAVKQENDKLGQKLDQLRQSGAGSVEEGYISLADKEKVLSRLQVLNSIIGGLDIAKVINSKLDETKKKFTIEGFSKAIELGLTMLVELLQKKMKNQGEELKKESSKQMEQLTKSQDKLQNEVNNLTKKYNELKNFNEVVKKERDDLQMQLSSTNSQSSQSTKQVKELQKQIQELQQAKQKAIEESQNKDGLIERLRQKVMSAEEQVNQVTEASGNAEENEAKIVELSNQLAEKEEELNNLKYVLEEKIQENDQLNNSIQNIQTVLDENQQINENITRQYDTQLKKLRNELEQANRKLSQAEDLKEKCDNYEKEHYTLTNQVKELNQKIRETEQSKHEIAAQADQLVKEMKAEAAYKDQLVDKRIVTNCLIKYQDMNATYKVKMGVLETLASLLNLEDEDRVKINLKPLNPNAYEKVAANSQQTPKSQGEKEPIKRRPSFSKQGATPRNTNKGPAFTFDRNSSKEQESESAGGTPTTKVQSPEPKVEAQAIQGEEGEQKKEEKKEEKKEDSGQKQKSLKDMFMGFLMDQEK